jgi:RNA polymerase sigma factor (TIGR02999 family)
MTEPVSSTAEETGPINSIAVLPLVNAGTESGDDYLCDGLTESIINRLAQLAQLNVLARSIVFRFKGRETDPISIGRELGVGAVLSGRMQSQDRRLIISLELVETATGWQIWGAQFDRSAAEILAIPEEIARAVSAKLQLQLTSQEQRGLEKPETGNTDAYRAYLRGRYYLNKRLTETLRQAIVHFQQATDHDPEYALAYVGLADAYALLSLYGALRPKDAFPKSKAAAMKALSLDPTLAEAHNSLGVVELFYEWDWRAAETAFRRALELNPHYADAHQRYGIYLTARERFDEAAAELELAQSLDPLSLINSTIAGYPAYYSREYERAANQFRQALEINPNFSMAHFRLGLTYSEQGKNEAALAELNISKSLSNDRDVVAALGRVYARMGDTARAQASLAELEDRAAESFVPSYDLAVIHAALGQTELALDWLEKAVEERSYWVIYLKIDPALDALRAESRFGELLSAAGLLAGSLQPDRALAGPSLDSEVNRGPAVNVTQLLVAWSEGDQTALDQLTPLVYDELRRLARAQLRNERPGHTLQTTALVNEAYLRLVDQRHVRWQNRAHFLAISAQLMRRILVDYARRRKFQKRGGGAVQVTLGEAEAISDQRAPDLVALDEALAELAQMDPRRARVVELKFFGGLNIDETAGVLKISPTTVERDWTTAKAWLYQRINS